MGRSSNDNLYFRSFLSSCPSVTFFFKFDLIPQYAYIFQHHKPKRQTSSPVCRPFFQPFRPEFFSTLFSRTCELLQKYFRFQDRGLTEFTTKLQIFSCQRHKRVHSEVKVCCHCSFLSRGYIARFQLN